MSYIGVDLGPTPLVDPFSELLETERVYLCGDSTDLPIEAASFTAKDGFENASEDEFADRVLQ